MYPANFFGLFPPFPRENKIFVAMSFDEQFKSRWKNVLEPAIEGVSVNGVPIEAVRVDTSHIGDSIITEILEGISRHLMVIADITTVGHLPTTNEGKPRPIRAANVMYEVGLAQAVRLPEEILMFRSDSDQLSFDISNIRVNSYNPDGDPEGSKVFVTNSIKSALSELDLKRHLAVRQAADSLDYTTWKILSQMQGSRRIAHPAIRTVKDALGSIEPVRAIAKLLDIGAVKTEFPHVTQQFLEDQNSVDMITYRSTNFGAAICREVSNRLNTPSPNGTKQPKQRFGLNNEKE